MMMLNTALVNPDPVLEENVVSLVPSEFNLIIRFTVTPLNTVKLPPIRSFPSGCSITAYIELVKLVVVPMPVPIFVKKVVSTVPSEFSLTSPGTVAPLN